jgi:hypothetical protein
MASPRTPPYRDPADCWICRRRAIGVGIGPPDDDKWAKNPRWICIECTEIAREARNMRNMDPYELIARRDASDKAGAFLDTLAEGEGKSDLADLSEEEWLKFWDVGLKEFGASIRRQVQEGSAPF